MGGGAFDPLNAGDRGAESAQQPKITTADLGRILSVGLSAIAVLGGWK
ncbi:hypothetical protein [Bradyrhizobium sp. AUGA SZCCT0283]|jgi:hypothetical protein|nr:hypothetical protein [Bradyrhizobium sp. AUGA SZCCT0283]MBR1277570.1 hypothetical protein [Bradyrhizobium sp. AUGA SZCCT0283]